jgi:long-chain acyl-CoA synthetase
LPLHHTFESTCGFLTPLTNGCTVVYARSLKSKQIIEDIGTSRATVMIGVPLLWENMYQAMRRKINAAPLVRRVLFQTLFSLSDAGWRLNRRWGRTLFASLRKKAGLSSVRLFVSGAAAMPPHIVRFFVLLGFDFIQGYGMTETSPVATAHRPDDIRFDTVGRPITGVEVRIDNPNQAGIGEVLVRGDNCTSGYRGNPEATADLLKDGWLHTGDLGKMQDGHLQITGRAKNLIVSAAGKNIYPEELEEKLLISNYILEAVVFGRAKEGRQGEEVRAILVPDLEQFRSEFGLDPEKPDRDQVMAKLKEVMAEVNERVAGYKRISGFAMQFEELEKTSTKKVKRFVYR